MEKSFLFDVVSRIYLATDLNPVDMSSYELCCDMIDVVVDVSCIYGFEVRTVRSWPARFIPLSFFASEEVSWNVAVDEKK